MKLLFDLSPADSAVLEAERGPDERVMYCLPFDCEFERRVDGRMVFTDRYIYKINEGRLEAKGNSLTSRTSRLKCCTVAVPSSPRWTA